MARRNLTIQLDDAVITGAKVLAARRGTSVSALVATELEALVESQSRYEAARDRALEVLREGSRRGGRTWTRDDLYDRPVMKRG